MIFRKHSEVEGKHSFLSPSYYHWLNYDDQKLQARFISATAAKRGSDIHNLASEAIRLGIKIHRSEKTLSKYVNDAIDYQMEPEQSLYYSENCFGTADAICFRLKVLRIFDLKTGLTPTSFNQLYVYAAIFCLEYGVSPFDIKIDLRIYQNEDVEVLDGDPQYVLEVMDTIIEMDEKLELLKEGGTL